GRGSVDLHMTASAHVGGLGAGLAQPDGPEPAVDTCRGGIHSLHLRAGYPDQLWPLSRASTSPWFCSGPRWCDRTTPSAPTATVTGIPGLGATPYALAIWPLGSTRPGQVACSSRKKAA